DGTLQAAVPYSVGPSDYVVRVADLNRDGIADLIASDTAATNFYVLLGNGDGTFQPAVPYNVGQNSCWPAVVDLNRDGVPDLVSKCPVQGVTLIGNGDGTFQSAVPFGSGGTPNTTHQFLFADFNRDGVLDALTVTTDVGINLGVSPGPDALAFQPA